MIKLVCLLQRRPELSREEFHRWWLEEHIPIVRQFPGVQKYVVSLTTGTVLGGADEWDGVAELWYESEADVDAVYASELGKTGVADTRAHVGRILRFFTREVVVELAGSERTDG